LCRNASISDQMDAISGSFCAFMCSLFCLSELSAEGPWSTLQSGPRAVHMDALWGKKGKLPGERPSWPWGRAFQAKRLILCNRK
jgi:hypothetical protein